MPTAQEFLASPSIQVPQKYMQCDLPLVDPRPRTFYLGTGGAWTLHAQPRADASRYHGRFGIKVRLSLFEIYSGLIVETIRWLGRGDDFQGRTLVADRSQGSCHCKLPIDWFPLWRPVYGGNCINSMTAALICQALTKSFLNEDKTMTTHDTDHHKQANVDGRFCRQDAQFRSKISK